MQDFVIDYALKDTMDDKAFARHIKIGQIRECKEAGTYTQKRAVNAVNNVLQFHGYEPTNLSVVKLYW